MALARQPCVSGAGGDQETVTPGGTHEVRKQRTSSRLMLPASAPVQAYPRAQVRNDQHDSARRVYGINRAQVRAAAAILGFLMPAFFDPMMANPGKDRGKPFYPGVP